MLRITKIALNGSPVTLKLEGKVHNEWVSLLHQECKNAAADAKEVLLDFSEVTYVDETGIELIRRLSKKHVRIINGDTCIADVNDRGGEAWNR